MDLNIPDKLYKFIIMLGIAVTVHGYLTKDKYDLLLTETREKIKSIYSNDQLNNDILQYKLNSIVNEGKKGQDSAGINKINFDKQLLEKYNKAIEEAEKVTIESKADKYNEEALDRKAQNFYERREDGEVYFLIGIALAFVGLLLWLIDESLSVVKQSEKIYSSCQSCGEQFSSIRLNGTNADGSPNLGLCGNCFNNGTFLQYNVTKNEFFAIIDNRIKGEGWLKRLFLKSRYKKLERWK